MNYLKMAYMIATNSRVRAFARFSILVARDLRDLKIDDQEAARLKIEFNDFLDRVR